MFQKKYAYYSCPENKIKKKNLQGWVVFMILWTFIFLSNQPHIENSYFRIQITVNWYNATTRVVKKNQKTKMWPDVVLKKKGGGRKE